MTNRTFPGKTGRRRFWTAHVEAHTKSGLTRAEYCRQHALSYYALTYWQKKLGKQSGPPESTLVPVPFEKIIPVPSGHSPDMRVVLPNKITIELGNNFNPSAFSRLLNVLARS